MKNKYGNVIWGILLIFLGLGLAGRFLLGWNFSIFFNGWWTLFIIIPCVISIVDTGFHSPNIILLIVGAMLFLSCQDGIGYLFSWRLIVPVVIIVVGLIVIISSFTTPKGMDFNGADSNCQNNTSYANDNFSNNNAHNNGSTASSADNTTYNSYSSSQGYSQNYNQNSYNYSQNQSNSSSTNESFKSTMHVNFGERTFRTAKQFDGCNLACSFGLLTLDLRNAQVNNNCTIQCNCSFGKIRIFLPQGVNAQIIISPVLGNLSNKVVNKVCEPPLSMITIQGSCSFGEVEVL